MIGRLVLFGATGDLAGRFLLPALARGVAAGELPDDLAIVGAAPQDWDDETFTAHVARRLATHAGEVPDDVRGALLRRLRYRRVDLADAASVARAVHGFADDDTPGADGDIPVAVYLALPPTLFPAAVAALGTADLPAGSRIAVEKPFGADLAGAVALNTRLAEVGGGAPGAVFRVDHALAMPGIRDLLRAREQAGDGAGWGSASIAQVDLLWEETLGLEGRADFFDRTGAVRDVVQNHLLQVLALVAAEPPAGASEQDLHAARLEAFRSVRVMTPADVAARTRRARYSAGELAGGAATAVPDYAREAGVDPGRGTETWAELRLQVDRPRWAGTTFVLRAGKALAVPRKGIRLHLRGDAAGDRPTWIELDGAPAAADPPTGSGTPIGGDGETVAAPAGTGELAAYGRVLADVLGGGSRLSVSSAEAEATWAIIEPVLAAWADAAAPLEEYPAGSPGPAPRWSGRCR